MVTNTITHNKTKILLWTLFFSSCFGLIVFNIAQLKYVFVFILLYYLVKSKSFVPYKRLLLLYLMFIVLSCIYSMYFNKQNFLRTFVYSYDYLGLLFCFLIMHYRPNFHQLERVVIILSVTFCCCYLFQWLIYPTKLFSGASDELNITNSVFRMRMPCSICAYCLFFYGINQYILVRRKKYLIFALLGLIPVFIMGFRSLTFCMIIFAVIMIPFITKSFKKTFIWLFLGLGAAFCVGQLTIVQDKVDEMSERQNSDQTFSNEDYIRYIEYDYYTKTIFDKPIERILGGGVPCETSTNYYKNITDATETMHLYWADLGLVGLSFIIGIPAVLLLMFIAISIIKNTKYERIQYIRFTILTVLLASIATSMEFYRSGNLLIMSIYICLQYCYSVEYKNSLFSKKEYDTKNHSLLLVR